MYFLDPEGNRVELLIDTPWYVPQPHRHVVDIDLPGNQLWASIEKHCRDTPGFNPAEEWRMEIAKKTAAAVRQPHSRNKTSACCRAKHARKRASLRAQPGELDDPGIAFDFGAHYPVVFLWR